MKKLYKEAEEFFRIHKTALFINACVCIICYGHLVFSQNVGIDTEHVINYPGTTMQWESIGRQGLLYTKKLFGILEYNPYLGGMLFLTSFILLGSMIMFLCWRVSGKDDSYPYGWFGVMFSTCPVWMIQFYFSLQRAEVVMGMLYGVISVFALCEILFFRQRRVYWFVLCLFFGVWCLASYQSCALLYISLCVLCYLLDFFRDFKREWQVYIKHILGMIAGFGIIYGAYYVLISRTLANNYYLSAQIKWGEYPVMQSFSLIFDHIKCMLNWHIESDVSAFPLSCICVFLLFCGYFWKERKNIVPLLFGLAGLMISPFLFTIYIGDKSIARTQFAQPLVCAAACMLFWGFCKKMDWKFVFAKRLSMAAAAVIVWICVSLILSLEYTEDIRYREDSIVAQTIAIDLGRIKEAEGLPIVLYGEKKAKLNGASHPADIYGYSFFQWDHSIGNPTGATWRVAGFMKTLGIDVESGDIKVRKKAMKVAKDLPCYPAEGYILVQKDYVVVKLSEE